MDSTLAPIIGILGTVIATLLTWIGWLVKKRLDESKENLRYQEEMQILVDRFLDTQAITLELIKEISRGLTLALKSDDLQFKSFHDSGLMNGESVKHRKMIEEYLQSVENLDQRIGEIDTSESFLKGNEKTSKVS